MPYFTKFQTKFNKILSNSDIEIKSVRDGQTERPYTPMVQ